MASKKLTRHDSPNDPKANRKRKSGRVSASAGTRLPSPGGVERFAPGADAVGVKSKVSARPSTSQISANQQNADAGSARGSASNLSRQVHVSSEPVWAKFSDRKLLDMKISELGIDFKQTSMVNFRDQLYRELKELGLLFKPHCWFSDDWFSPDQVPGIAIPFYMAHRRLMRLERNQMLEVEGGTKEWCMRIMRHEAGHALDTAFGLHRKRGYKATFGSYSAPYPETYVPKPRSKKFVLHLEPWYAQSHPAEDFAETFAVWMTPNSRWRKNYQGWPALKKLKFVDEMMERIQGQKPKVTSRAKVDPVHRIDVTLREHYQQRQQFYSLGASSVFDDELKKLFCEANVPHQNKTAASYLRRNKVDFCKVVEKWSGEYQHNIVQVVREMTERCRALKLFLPVNDENLRQECLLMMTVQTMNYLKRRHRVAL